MLDILDIILKDITLKSNCTHSYVEIQIFKVNFYVKLITYLLLVHFGTHFYVAKKNVMSIKKCD